MATQSRRFFRHPALTILLPFLAALAAVESIAHPTGVSKIDFYLEADTLGAGADTLEATVDVNRDDLYFALGVSSLQHVPKDEYDLLNDRIALYFQTRIPVAFDKPLAGPVKVLHWSKLSRDPARKMDSLALADTTIVMRLGWPMAPGTSRMEAQVKLFAELQVQPLAHVRVHWNGKVVNRRFLGLDGRMTLSVAPDSLAALAARQEAGPGGEAGSGASGEDEGVFMRFLKLGFLHILPYGLDHILFVLGLFFFSTLMRPLLIQVTAFTIAHSITLGLSLVGLFSLPAEIVEPLIALSIAVVALENIFFRRMKPSRWMVVFAFGLIHGMGFAGVLRGLGLPEGQFLTTLLSFNLGVELGQLAVILLAYAATFWAWNKPWYFRFVVVPVSLAIALTGLYWTVTRIIG